MACIATGCIYHCSVTHTHTLSRLWSIFTAVMLAVSRSFFQVTMMEDMCAKAFHLPVISFEFKTHMFPNVTEEKGGVVLEGAVVV